MHLFQLTVNITDYEVAFASSTVTNLNFFSVSHHRFMRPDAIIDDFILCFEFFLAIVHK